MRKILEFTESKISLIFFAISGSILAYFSFKCINDLPKKFSITFSGEYFKTAIICICAFACLALLSIGLIQRVREWETDSMPLKVTAFIFSGLIGVFSLYFAANAISILSILIAIGIIALVVIKISDSK